VGNREQSACGRSRKRGGDNSFIREWRRSEPGFSHASGTVWGCAYRARNQCRDSYNQTGRGQRTVANGVLAARMMLERISIGDRLRLDTGGLRPKIDSAAGSPRAFRLTQRQEALAKLQAAEIRKHENGWVEPTANSFEDLNELSRFGCPATRASQNADPGLDTRIQQCSSQAGVRQATRARYTGWQKIDLIQMRIPNRVSG